MRRGIIAIIVIILMDYAMLFIGYVYEAEMGLRDTINNLANWIPIANPNAYALKYGMVDPAAKEDNTYSLYNYRGLFLGWLPFLGILSRCSWRSAPPRRRTTRPGYAIFTVLITFVTWGLYGVVALVFRSPQAKMKNASYNVLDIVSKNIVGLVTSIVALSTLQPGWRRNPRGMLPSAANASA